MYQTLRESKAKKVIKFYSVFQIFLLNEKYSKNPLEEGLRVIVVKLPVGADKEPKFQYLVTNLTEDWNSEYVHHDEALDREREERVFSGL